MEKPDDFNLLDDLNNNPNQFINLYKMSIDGIAAKLELSTPDDNKLIALEDYHYRAIHHCGDLQINHKYSILY